MTICRARTRNGRVPHLLFPILVLSLCQGPPPHSHGDTLVHTAMPPPNSHPEGHASRLGKHTESAKQDGVQERGGCRPQRCSGPFGQELQVPRHLRCGVECGMGPAGHGGSPLPMGALSGGAALDLSWRCGAWFSSLET